MRPANQAGGLAEMSNRFAVRCAMLGQKIFDDLQVGGLILR